MRTNERFRHFDLSTTFVGASESEFSLSRYVRTCFSKSSRFAVKCCNHSGFLALDLPCPSRFEYRADGFPHPVCQELFACGLPQLVRHVDLSLDLKKLILVLQNCLTDPVVSM